MNNSKVYNTMCLLSIFFFMYIGVDTFIISYDIFKTIDRELYFYGYNRLNKYDYIARQVRPIGRINARLYGTDYCFNGFSLQVGEYGQNFINKGGVINEILVDSICSYGFNEHLVVTELITKEGFRYYDIADFADFNNSKEIRIDTSCITNPVLHFNLSKWIHDVNHPAKSLCKMSDFCIRLFLTIIFCEIVLIIISILILYKMINKFVRKSHSSDSKRNQNF